MDSELLTCPNPEIAPEDWQRTLSSVQQTILQMVQCLAALEQEVNTLRAENERLREQTRCSLRNSSQPPSSDSPSVPARRRRKPRGKPRGAQQTS
jgi:hypothetical protein